jgi:hypothetical protein
VYEMIASFLRYTGIRPETFGRLTLNDPNLLPKLKAGHELNQDAAERVIQFMNRYEDGKS